MRITISGKDFKPTPANQEYITAKLSKLERFHPNIRGIGVELDVDHHAHSGNRYRAEVWVHLSAKDIKAGIKAETMKAAIDLLYPKLERQLVKHKEKLVGRPKTWSAKGKQPDRT